MNGPPIETCVEFLARQDREWAAYLALLAARCPQNDLVKTGDLGSMHPDQEVDLESDIREVW